MCMLIVLSCKPITNKVDDSLAEENDEPYGLWLLGSYFDILEEMGNLHINEYFTISPGMNVFKMYLRYKYDSSVIIVLTDSSLFMCLVPYHCSVVPCHPCNEKRCISYRTDSFSFEIVHYILKSFDFYDTPQFDTLDVDFSGGHSGIISMKYGEFQNVIYRRTIGLIVLPSPSSFQIRAHLKEDALFEYLLRFFGLNQHEWHWYRVIQIAP